jgi:hypothetical protein
MLLDTIALYRVTMRLHRVTMRLYRVTMRLYRVTMRLYRVTMRLLSSIAKFNLLPINEMLYLVWARALWLVLARIKL